MPPCIIYVPARGRYAELLPKLAARHQGTPIILFSQGDPADFSELVAAVPSLTLGLDEPMPETFHALVCASALVVGRSSFSYSAAILSRGVVYADPLEGWWHKPLGTWRRLRDAPSGAGMRAEEARAEEQAPPPSGLAAATVLAPRCTADDAAAAKLATAEAPADAAAMAAAEWAPLLAAANLRHLAPLLASSPGVGPLLLRERPAVLQMLEAWGVERLAERQQLASALGKAWRSAELALSPQTALCAKAEVRLSVHPSVHPSLHPSMHPSVRPSLPPLPCPISLFDRYVLRASRSSR